MKNLIVLGFILFLASGFASPASADETADRLNAVEAALENALSGNGNSLARTVTSYVTGVGSGATLSSDIPHLIEVGALSLTDGSIWVFYGPGIATVAAVAMENNYQVSVSIEYDATLDKEIVTTIATVK